MSSGAATEMSFGKEFSYLGLTGNTGPRVVHLGAVVSSSIPLVANTT